MKHDKEKLYEMGGVVKGLVNKWNEKSSPPPLGCYNPHPSPDTICSSSLFWIFCHF